MNATVTRVHLNRALNILILSFVVILAGMVIYRTCFQDHFSSESQILKTRGFFDGLREINFSKTQKTVLIALDSECFECDRSFPYLKNLIANFSQQPGTRVIALFDNGHVAAEGYLRKHDLDIEFVPKADLAVAGFEITPTIIVVNSDRIITASYEGALSEVGLFEVQRNFPE